MADADRAVLITGASTGIGEACARYLDDKGFRVFAGVRKEADGERLQEGQTDRLTPLILDVTDQSQIDAAVKSIGEAMGGKGLAGLVNNAGIALGGPLEYLELDEWRNQFDVNVFGQIAMTKSALPLIRDGHGRIVFIGSIAGRVATPLMGPYAASKHAIEAVAESLWHELHPFGIHVAVIEPGAIATAIWGKGRETTQRLTDALPPEAEARYGDRYEKLAQGLEENDRNGIAPVEVAKAVDHALFNSRPRPRYLVGRDAQMAGYADKLVPDAVMQTLITRLG